VFHGEHFFHEIHANIASHRLLTGVDIFEEKMSFPQKLPKRIIHFRREKEAGSGASGYSQYQS